MQNKSPLNTAFVSPRALVILLVCAAICLVVTRTLPAFLRSEAPANLSQRTLTFTERVAYQRAIEDVYWRHRIWPRNRGERPDSKPSLDAVMSQEQLENKVADYLRKSQALEDYWQRPITGEQLQAEMDRMAKHTKQPEVLGELFAVLGNDSFLIAECLARPTLADRLLTSWYAYDEGLHGELKHRAEAELSAHTTAEQMKQLSGSYSEIEFIKDDSVGTIGQADHLPKGQLAGGTTALRQQNSPHGVKLNNHRWDETVQKLAAIFHQSGSSLLNGRDGSPSRPLDLTKTYQTLPIGKISLLQEDETRFYATALIDKSDHHLTLATVSWLKEPLESWLSRTQSHAPTMSSPPIISYTLPNITDGKQCVDNTWTPTAGPPDVRNGHTAVWTGSEMIIWGGNYGNYPYFYFRNTGARYNPSTDTWTTTGTINAPTGRVGHTAVWTGSEMIVWGGADGLFSVTNTGGRYNPVTESWTPTSTTNAPDEREIHTAVWSESEMIVWGGTGAGYLNTGGKYNPTTDAWVVTSTINAPDGRYGSTGVWTGNEMIVWGGTNDSMVFDTGGRYNPVTNAWIETSTNNAPTARQAHTAVWTGSEMIVWGGGDLSSSLFNTGGRYNPSTNSWIATSTINAPTARSGPSGVWTGSQMIAWGGWNGTAYLNTGARYDPSTNGWTATTTNNGPAGRSGHTAVWSGSEMIVWGGSGETGYFNSGGRYNPVTNTWTNTNTYNAPEARYSHAAVWTGSEMVIWGGDDYPNVLNTGGRYDPVMDNWASTSTVNAPPARSAPTVVWSGSEMIVWGGDNGSALFNTGGRYNPSTNEWTATSTTNAPTARNLHTAVWTGSEMIIWGGWDGFDDLNNGGLYNPTTNAWVVVNTTGAPIAREAHTAVWAGNEMIVWGGWNFDSQTALNTGGRFNPATGNWTPTETTNAPDGRTTHTAVWTGSEMLVWGGTPALNTGGRYNPTAHSWTAISPTNAPDGRTLHSAVWTGSEMIVWGGAYLDPTYHIFVPFNSGGRYTPTTDHWAATNLTNAPDPRYIHTAVWSGNEMIIWGGGWNSGGRYCAQSGPPPSPTPTPTASPSATPTPTATPTATVTGTPTVSPTPTTTVTPSSTPTTTVTPSSTPRITPTPRAHPSPRARPTAPPHLTPVPTPSSPRPTAWPRPTSPPHITPVPPPSSQRPTPAPRP